ncbi:hypothetical protein BGW39_009460 [Mortierella sp. 14UC]|nr:hypothetical protein BGW39_009460 [Mortierella sp. 14UC]
MTLYQCFQHGDLVETLDVRQDEDGPPYSRLDDIEETFSGAVRFKLEGRTLNFLLDEKGKNVSASSSGRGEILSRFSKESMESVSTAMEQPLIPTTNLARSQTYSSAPSKRISLQAATMARSSTTLSSIASTALSEISSDINRIRHKLDRSTDQQSSNHQQVVQRMFHMVQQQNEVLLELTAAKERDLETHRLQKQTINRLIVAQQHIDAILVQNYELHEYPIPRLFVILPDSYERWDPRNLMTERFRLYFLCECGDNCNTGISRRFSTDSQLALVASSLTANIPVKNTIHLAKHEGYELSRPTDFFERYGPYVLGMLQVLRDCLTVATSIVPAAGLAENGVKGVLEGVKSISEYTMDAINVSIGFLEKKLEEDKLAKDTTKSNTDNKQQEEDIFRGLAALEGADLRQLDTFLKTNDKDKILGNLYRITTETGHVKWVCLEHYRQVYRATAMASFLKCVKANDGAYDEQLATVTVTLRSSTAAKDFFGRLSAHASAVNRLKVTLDWAFRSADLAKMVDKIAQSNVRDLELDLREFGLSFQFSSSMRLGKGRYHSLLGLLSNDKIKTLTLANIDLIGPRSSRLSSSLPHSLLQSFHYLSIINAVDDSRLASIISHCPQLVDLRLGSLTWASEGVPQIDQAIGSLTLLKSLRRYSLNFNSISEANAHSTPYGSVPLRELVEHGRHFYVSTGLLEAAIQRSSATLEVLLLNLNSPSTTPTLDLANLRRGLPSSTTNTANSQPFARLTHLELPYDISTDSLGLLVSALPTLAPVHLDVNMNSADLLTHISIRQLRSVCIEGAGNDILKPFFQALLKLPSGQIDSLRLATTPWSQELSDLLKASPLKRLSFEDVGNHRLNEILASVNFSKLQVLTIFDEHYQWDTEAILAARSAEFLDQFELQLGYNPHNPNERSDVYEVDARVLQGSPTRLDPRHVRVIEPLAMVREYYASVLPGSF